MSERMATAPNRNAVRQRAVFAVLSENSLRAAAAKSGICERTLRRWLREPEFKAEYDDARRALASEARERLEAYQGRAVERLRELMEQTGPPSTALSATRDVLDRTMGKAVEEAQGGAFWHRRDCRTAPTSEAAT